WPARWHDVLECIKALPGRFDARFARERYVFRWLLQLEVGNVPRAIGKDRLSRHADNQLSPGDLVHQRIVAFDTGDAVDTQPLSLAVHRDEQQPDMRIDADIAEALEHAVAVVIGKRELRWRGNPDEPRRAALERAIGM